MADHVNNVPVWIGDALVVSCAYCSASGADPGGGMCRSCVGTGWHVLENAFSIQGHDDDEGGGDDDDEDGPSGEPPDSGGPEAETAPETHVGQLTVGDILAAQAGEAESEAPEHARESVSARSSGTRQGGGCSAEGAETHVARRRR